ncbi:MAG: chromate transporter [Synergistaceae bacterium]|nr:chromate transporter [Synergistaceae bacterium]MBQ6971112.1 chromate transporter [Synergistaceae bacterium]
MMLYAKLFWEFFQTGLFAVGGGMATLPFLYSISDRTGWFTHEQLADMIAVSESTPGAIGVNMATYSGYITAGLPGAVISTAGLITPSIIVILLVAAFLNAFHENRYVVGAFYGLRPASSAMITAAGLILARVVFFFGDFSGGNVNVKAVILAGLLLVFTHTIAFTRKLHPVIWIAFSAAVGIVFEF